MDSIPWTQKYRPKTLKQVAGNEEAVEKILGWLRRFNDSIGKKETQQKRAALLHGPPGTGKTVTVEAIANDLGYVLVETNASDFRTSEQIERWIARSIGYKTLEQAFSQGRERMILFDEVDGISGEEDRGGVGAIIRVIKETRCPVFLTANDIYQPKLRELRQHCTEIGFKKLEDKTVVSYLDKICKNESIAADVEALLLIARNSDGDLRVAINDLQVLGKEKSVLTTKDVTVYARDEQIQTFDALRRFFAAKTWSEARKYVEEATIDYEMMILCIHESLPYQFKNLNDLAAAYDLLSRASMFLNRAQRERAWQLMKYFFDLMISVPLLRRHGLPSSYVRFSQKLVEMARSRSERSLRKEIGLLIGRKCHVSSTVAIREIVPYVRIIFSSNPKAAAELIKGLELEEGMVEYLSPENADQILRLMK